MAFVDYLIPYTNYQFEVLAINDGGSGESESSDERTLEAGLYFSLKYFSILLLPIFSAKLKILF